MVGRAQWQAHETTGHFASATPVHGMVLPQFRAGCPTVINLIQKPFTGSCTWNDNLKCHSSEGVYLGFFETGSLTGLEIAEQTRLASELQRFICLCIAGSGITNAHQQICFLFMEVRWPELMLEGRIFYQLSKGCPYPLILSFFFFLRCFHTVSTMTWRERTLERTVHSRHTIYP